MEFMVAASQLDVKDYLDVINLILFAVVIIYLVVRIPQMKLERE